MNKLIMIVIVSFTLFGQAHAEKPDEIYKSCRLTGFFDGAKDNFYAGLSDRVSIAKNIQKDATCDASYESGFNVGESVKKNINLKNDQEKKILNEAKDFKKKIQDSILHTAGLI